MNTNSNWKRLSLDELIAMAQEIKARTPGLACYELLCEMSARILAANMPEAREGFLAGPLPKHHRIACVFADEMLMQNGLSGSLCHFPEELAERIGGAEPLLFLEMSDDLLEFYRRKVIASASGAQAKLLEFTDL